MLDQALRVLWGVHIPIAIELGLDKRNMHCYQ